MWADGMDDVNNENDYDHARKWRLRLGGGVNDTGKNQ